MKYLAIILLFTATLNAAAQDKVEFSREKNYKRMTMSKEALIKLIKAIQYYHNENLPDTISLSTYRKHSINLEIGRNNESQILTGFQQIEKIELDGKDYTRLEITYLNTEQAISSINLNLASYNRRLAIKGTDQQKVNALFRELDEHLIESQNFLAFINWSAVISATALCLFVLCQFIFFQIKPQENNPGSIRLAKTIKNICVIYDVIFIAFFLSPLELSELFPGFTLTAEPSLWWDKYGNFIGVFSVIIPATIAIIKFLSKILVFTNTNETSPAATEIQAPQGEEQT